jgi:outer membrane protein
MIAVLLLPLLACAQDTSRLTLTQAVDRALATHPSVALARAQHEHASADVGTASATRFPQLNIDATMNQFQEPMVVAPLHGFDPRNPPQFDRTLLQSGLSLVWTVYDFGSRTNYVRAERALERAADIGVSGAQAQLMDQTVGAYLEVLSARETLVAQDERLTALRSEADRVRQRLEQGKAARIEGLRVDADAKQAQADRIATAARVTTAEHTLANLTQMEFSTVHATRFGGLRLADSLLATDSAGTSTAELYRQARLTSYDVRELEERQRSSESALAGIRATGYPELHLSSAYVDRGSAKGDFRAEWQLGLALSYPLYGGGSHESAVRKAEADARGATEQLRLARLNIEQGVDRAFAALREAHAQSAALESASEESAEVARIERLSLDVGSGTQTDYLNAEANLLRARASLIEARHAEISARVSLARIVGQLSRDWLARTLETTP